MATELLDENGQKGSVIHKYRHEVESLIWVFTWVSCQRLSDGTLRSGFLEQVGQVDAIQCAKEKSLFLRLIPEFPDGVDKHLGTRALRFRFLLFLERKLHLPDNIRADLRLAHSQLEIPDDEQAASELKETVAELEAQLDGETDGNMFRDFAKEIGFHHIEDKVKRAAKSIPTGPQ